MVGSDLIDLDRQDGNAKKLPETNEVNRAPKKEAEDTLPEN